MSYPIFFEPLRMGNYYLVDGGLADNLPVHIAAAEGFNHILAINVGSFKTWTTPVKDAANGGDLGSAVKIVSRCLDIALHRMYRRGRTGQAELTLSAVNGASALAFHRKKELIALGEQTVRDNAADLAAFFGLGLAAYLGRRQYRRRQVIPREIPIFSATDIYASSAP
jgi:NTE family protein